MSRPSYPFDVRSRDVWAIALPASVAFITEPLVGLVDITVIGRLGDATLLGGLVLGALAFDMIFSIVFFLRLGTAGLTAQAVGARDADDGLVHFVRAALLGVGLGVVAIALSGPLEALLAILLGPSPAVEAPFSTYLWVRLWSAPFVLINFALLGWFYGRAAAKTGMALQMLINGVNAALCVLFVYGLGWAVAGAALAAVVGHAVSATVGLMLVVRHFGGLGPTLRLLSWRRIADSSQLLRLFALSRDLMIRSIALMSAFAWFTAQTARMGEVSLAANAVLMQFLMVSAFFLDGQGQAAEQLCGKAVGANWRPAFETSIRLTMGWGLVLSSVLFSAIWFGGGAMIDFMTTDPLVQAEARTLLILAALTAFTGMPAFVLDGIMSGATLNAVIRNGMVASLVIYLGLAYLLRQSLGVAGLWVAINLFFVTRTVIFWWAVRWKLPSLFTAQVQPAPALVSP